MSERIPVSGPWITQKEIDSYVAAHPAKKAELYNPLTVVKRKGSDLIGVPYHVQFKQWLEPAVQGAGDGIPRGDWLNAVAPAGGERDGELREGRAADPRKDPRRSTGSVDTASGDEC